MTKQQPQPGQVWERDGKRREVTWISWRVVAYVRNRFKMQSSWGVWLAWQSGAKLVEGGEGDE